MIGAAGAAVICGGMSWYFDSVAGEGCTTIHLLLSLGIVAPAGVDDVANSPFFYFTHRLKYLAVFLRGASFFFKICAAQTVERFIYGIRLG